MDNMSPTTGSHVKKASKLPYFSIRALCLSNSCSFTLNHFSIHSHFPILPMPYVETPPNQLPEVAAMKAITGFTPRTSTPVRIISELKGIIVAARKEPRKSPIRPYCCRKSTISLLCVVGPSLSEKLPHQSGALIFEHPRQNFCFGMEQ